VDKPDVGAADVRPFPSLRMVSETRPSNGSPDDSELSCAAKQNVVAIASKRITVFSRTKPRAPDAGCP